MKEFIKKMLELGAKLDKAVNQIEINMIINDAETLYKKQKEFTKYFDKMFFHRILFIKFWQDILQVRKV